MAYVAAALKDLSDDPQGFFGSRVI
jgi:hypothetical protein